jgi:hypothetical protein
LIEEQARARSLSVVHGTTGFLGGLIGDMMDARAFSAFVKSQVDEHAQFFELLKHPHMPAQIALLLLRASGVPRFIYLSRVVHFNHAADEFVAFDNAVTNCFMSIMDLSPSTLSDVAAEQIHWPIREGGLGLTSLSRNRTASYTASFLTALPHLIALFPSLLDSNGTPGTVTAEKDSWIALSVAECFNELRKQPVLAAVLPDPEVVDLVHSHADGAPHQYQRYLTGLLAGAQKARVLMEKAKEQDRAALLSASAKGASYWLTTPPSEEAYTLPTKFFRLAVRHLLRVVPSDRLPSHCACGFELDDYQHFHSCKLTRGAEVTHRHNNLRNVLARLYRELHDTVVIEPYHYQEQYGLRPDFEAISDRSVSVIDVSVTSPAAPSFVARSARGEAKAAEAREQSKSREYVKIMKADDHIIVHPFVLETHGAPGPRTRALVKALSQRAEDSGMSTAREFSARVWRAVSFALQWGNAWIASRCSERARVSVMPFSVRPASSSSLSPSPSPSRRRVVSLYPSPSSSSTRSPSRLSPSSSRLRVTLSSSSSPSPSSSPSLSRSSSRSSPSPSPSLLSRPSCASSSLSSSSSSRSSRSSPSSSSSSSRSSRSVVARRLVNWHVVSSRVVSKVKASRTTSKAQVVRRGALRNI